MNKLNFTDEFKKLLEEANEFAILYPDEASQLQINSLNNKDPYLERLFEGVAYLHAKVSNKIQESVSDISKNFLRQNWPYSLKPMPSAVVLKMQYAPFSMHVPQFIPMNTEIFPNSALNAKKAIFRLSYHETLWPLSIECQGLTPLEPGKMSLTLTIAVDKSALLTHKKLSDIKFFIALEPHKALHLLYLLLQNIHSLVITVNKEKLHPLNKIISNCQLFSLAHVGSQATMLANEKPDCQNNMTWTEYFWFLEKHFFLHLSKNIDFDCTADMHTLELKFIIECDNQELINLPKNCLDINCLPAINIFNSNAEPICVDFTNCEYAVNPDLQPENKLIIYNIHAVVGIDNKGLRTAYKPSYDFEHHSGMQAYFSFRQEIFDNTPLKTYIAIGGVNNFEAQTISCELEVSNSTLARELYPEGTFLGCGSQLPQSIQFINITRPSEFLMPKAYQNAQWELVGHLNHNIQGLSKVENLKSLLHLLNWSNIKKNKSKIDAITEVSLQYDYIIESGIFKHKVIYTLSLFEHAFSNQGDIYLFGLILHNFLSNSLEINYLLETNFLCCPSNIKLAWKDGVGSACPI